MKPITTLLPHQVLVFGSNAQGFHGAGAAGYAMRGTSANTWRDDPVFLNAMRARVGSPDRVGKWAVFGIARGWQRGKEGMSYAIETIRHPGKQWHRSVPWEEIALQLWQLFDHATLHPEWEYLATPIGVGLAGWTPLEMAKTWNGVRQLYDDGKLPSNLIAPPDLYEGLNWRET